MGRQHLVLDRHKFRCRLRLLRCLRNGECHPIANVARTIDGQDGTISAYRLGAAIGRRWDNTGERSGHPGDVRSCQDSEHARRAPSA